MATGVQDWSTTPGSNATADSGINWSEGQLGPTVNNSARGMMASIKAWANTIGGGVSYGGAGNAYTITNDAPGAWASLSAPRLIMLKANHTNSGAATVAVDGLTATAIRKNGVTALGSGDIISGALYLLCYDGTYFQIIGNIPALSQYQPIDATLTSIAAVATANNRFLMFTGTDTSTAFDLFGTANAWASGQSFGDANINISLAAGIVYYGFDANDYWTYTRASNSLGLVIGGAELFTFTSSLLTAPGFSTAGAVTAGSVTATTITARVAISGETTGTLTVASANKHLALTGGITLPNAVFAAGDMMTIDPGTAARTITRGASIAMYVNGADSATATLAANQMGGVHWRSPSVCVLTGAVS